MGDLRGSSLGSSLLVYPGLPCPPTVRLLQWYTVPRLDTMMQGGVVRGRESHAASSSSKLGIAVSHPGGHAEYVRTGCALLRMLFGRLCYFSALVGMNGPTPESFRRCAHCAL